MSTIYSIVYQPKNRKYEEGHFDSFIREPVTKAALIANHGIDGDAKAGKQPSRQLNILSLEWLASLNELGYKTGPGDFGEQIIIKDLDIDALHEGDRLQIGATAVVEIADARHGCTRLEAAQGRSNKDFGGLVGKMARVITGGVIQVDDQVTLA